MGEGASAGAFLPRQCVQHAVDKARDRLDRLEIDMARLLVLGRRAPACAGDKEMVETREHGECSVAAAGKRGGEPLEVLRRGLLSLPLLLSQRRDNQMRDDITIETDLFEHREVKPHFINPCCFGEDFAAWLRGKLTPLTAEGFLFADPIQEDYGWGFWASHRKDRFWIALSSLHSRSPDTEGGRLRQDRQYRRHDL